MDGRPVDFYGNPDAEVDPGPWGQTKFITYKDELPNPTNGKETIIRGERYITPQSGEPPLRTFTITVDNECQQPEGVAGWLPTVYDVHLVAVINYGVGGAQQTVELSVRRGTTFTIAATYWDVSLFIEPMPDPNNYAADALPYPNRFTGPKTVKAACSCALGTRPSGFVGTIRDTPFRWPTIIGVSQKKRIKIPQNAVNVSFAYTGTLAPYPFVAYFPASGFAAPLDSILSYADTRTPGAKTPIPVGAFELDVVVTDPDAGNQTLFVTWEILL